MELSREQEIEVKFNDSFFQFLSQNSKDPWVRNLINDIVGDNLDILYFSRQSFEKKQPDQIAENSSSIVVFENKTISKTSKQQFKDYSKILKGDNRAKKYFILIAPKYSHNIDIYNHFKNISEFSEIDYIFIDFKNLYELATKNSAPVEFLDFIRVHSKEIGFETFDRLFDDVLVELQNRNFFFEKKINRKSSTILPYHQRHFYFGSSKKPEYRLRIGFNRNQTDRFIIGWYKLQCGEYSYTLGKEDEDSKKYINSLKKRGFTDVQTFDSIRRSAKTINSVYNHLKKEYNYPTVVLHKYYDKKIFESEEINEISNDWTEQINQLYEYTKNLIANL